MPKPIFKTKRTQLPLKPEFPADPSQFVAEITNPYLAFQIGKKFYYEGETDEGVETIVVEVTSEKKTILGVSTTVVHDQGFLDGEILLTDLRKILMKTFGILERIVRKSKMEM